MFEKRKVMVFVVFLVILFTLLVTTRTRNCSSDYACFERSLNRCSIAEVNALSDGNLYKYEIIGKKQDACILEIKLLKLSETQPAEMQEALNGRAMKCSFSKELIESKKITEIKNMNDYCTGPLKEATLEITVDQMYELIVKNIGSIAMNISN